MSDWEAEGDLELMDRIRLAAANCAHCREIWESLLGHLKAHEAAGRFVVTAGDAA